MVAANPSSNTVTPNYRIAAEAMLSGASLYPSDPQQHGWLYLLPSAMLYVPFVLPPLAVGEVLWRVVCVAMLAISVRRLSRLVDEQAGQVAGPDAPPQSHFLLLTLLALPASMGSVLNGQMNVTIGACFVLAAVATSRRAWWSAAAWLALALAFKPIAIVLVLLITAVHRPLWWRTPLAILVMLASPLAVFNAGYVLEQYQAGMATVVRAGEPGAGTFAELGTLLRAAGLDLSHGEMTVLRLAGALATLAGAWFAVRRFSGAWAAVLVLILGTAYLMAFNPRTEGNSYVILAPGVAAAAAMLLAIAYPLGRVPMLRPRSPAPAWFGWMGVLVALVLGFAHLVAPGGKDRTFKPLAAAVTWVVLVGGAAVHSVPRRSTKAARPPA